MIIKFTVFDQFDNKITINVLKQIFSEIEEALIEKKQANTYSHNTFHFISHEDSPRF